jgi:hypothetical protein
VVAPEVGQVDARPRPLHHEPAVDQHPARGGGIDQSDGGQQGGLAGVAGAQQGGHHREQPQRGLRSAIYTLLFMVSVPLQWQRQAPTPAAAFWQDHLAGLLKRTQR